MKKWVFAGIILLTSNLLAVPPLDRYGGHYSVIQDTSPYNLTYRFYNDPGQTGVNKFEYLSQMDTIYSIWKATAVASDCDRWRICNLILERRVDIYMNYPPGVHRDSTPWDPMSVIYYSTTQAVVQGFVSQNVINYQVKYSTVQICEEGKGLPFP